MNRIARLGALALFPFTTAMGLANASTAATTAASSSLSSSDYNFVAQANLGAPFQVDSGRLAERKAGTAAVRDYAHLMVVTHIPSRMRSTQSSAGRASTRRQTRYSTAPM